jgi:di/tripeptidase
VGYEQAPGVVLQAHLDMVCQKNATAPTIFRAIPSFPGCATAGWSADKTTLGADNGIGVALILAVLEDESIEHGPLEALLTVDEEAGMGGARGLAAGVLQGRLMLNLDTEDWGEFYLGLRRGLDVNVVRGPDRPSRCRPAMSSAEFRWAVYAAGIPASISTRSGAMRSSCWCACCANWRRVFPLPVRTDWRHGAQCLAARGMRPWCSP